MNSIATTKLSSKGQVVIPEEIRNKLKLKTGSKFVVIGDRDVVILKKISMPNINEFSNLINKARQSAKKVGLTKNDISDAIKSARDNI